MFRLGQLAILASLFITSVAFGSDITERNLDSNVCRLIKNKFYAANTLDIYSLIFDPIRKGKLVVWNGVSTLPTSEFSCNQATEVKKDEIIINFASFANKLEWTFFGE